jgi:L-serine/L-threonine ammonia-lyase
MMRTRIQNTSPAGHEGTPSQKIHQVICSSGGNAGHAVATTGERLNIPVKVFVPETTLPLMIAKIRSKKNTEVFVKGANWNESNAYALQAMESDREGTCLYVPPYDHPLIWEGNSSIVDELFDDCQGDVSLFPDVIVLSVGGGGLLRGVQLGLERLGLAHKTEIIAVETAGTASFAASKAAGRLTRLDRIVSVATSLGALSVVESCLTSAVKTTSVVVSDAEAVDACYAFVNSHRMLVEPACGATLAALHPRRAIELFGNIMEAKGQGQGQGQGLGQEARLHVAVVVCGGGAVDLPMLQVFRDRVGTME